MPTYEYRCKDCGHQFDVVQAFTDDALTECPACGGALKKVFGNVGHHVQGLGFYKTDSRSAGSFGSAKDADAVRQRLQARRTKASTRAATRTSSAAPSSSSKLDSSSATSSAARGSSSSSSSTASSQLVLQAPPSLSVAAAPHGRRRRLRRLGLLPRSSTTSPRSPSTRPTGRPSAPDRRRPPRRPARWPSSPATAPTTSSRRTGSPTGPTCGRCTRSASPTCSGPCASGSLQAHVAPGQLRGARPAGRPHVGPARHVLRRPDRPPRRLRRPLRRRPAPGRRSTACRAEGVDGARRRHGRRRSRGPGSPPGPSRGGSASHGWEVINMTQHPEAVLCREAGPALRRHRPHHRLRRRRRGHAASPPVTQEEVFAFFEANVETVRTGPVPGPRPPTSPPPASRPAPASDRRAAGHGGAAAP